MILDNADRSLQLVLGEARTTSDCDIIVCYAQTSGSQFVPTLAHTVSNGTTVVTVLAAPGSGQQFMINEVRLHNNDTVAHTVTLRLLDTATVRIVLSGIVLAGADWVYTPGAGSNTTSVTVPVASATTPLMDGVGAPGVSAAWSRGDHRHPTDTTLAPLASPTFTGSPVVPGYLTTAAAASTYAALDAWAPIFGTGADGNVTISSGTTTLTRDMHYANLTINGTGVLAPAGWRVFVRDTLDLSAAPNGAFVRNANTAPAAVGSAFGAQAAAMGQTWVLGVGQLGASGRTGNTTNSTAAASNFNTNNPIIGGDGGPAGGPGGTGSWGAARVGGTSTAVTTRFTLVTPTTDLLAGYLASGSNHMLDGGAGGAGGAAGTGDTVNSGGGGAAGGQGGGVIALYARTIARGTNSATGVIQVNGGAGGGGGTPPSGNCGGGGGGAGGGGGFVYIVTGGVTGSSIAGALDVSGGVGGAGGNGIGTGLGGGSGAGGNGGMVVLINLGAATTTVNSYNTAGTAGSTTATITGAAGGAGASALVAL